MENKETIIDGVDVSGCEFCDWKGSEIPQCRIRQASFEPICKGYNCYYKQLARKTAECEKYKQALDEIEEICKVNAINTCWTVLNLCDKCDEKEECCLQSPLVKLDAISNIINKTKE